MTISLPPAPGLISARLIARHAELPYLYLSLLPAAPWQHQAGQYTAFCSLADGVLKRRYYSIASAPAASGSVDFCLLCRPGSEAASLYQDLALGSELWLAPAAGEFRLRQTPRPKVYIAGGSGISPIRALLQEQLRAPGQSVAHLVFGCQDGAGFPYLSEWLHLAAEPRFRAWLCAEAGYGQSVQAGRVTSFLSAAILPGAEYYICGPGPMQEAVLQILAEQQVRPEQIFRESFG